MLLSAVSVLVVAQSSSEVPEGLMNNPVYIHDARGCHICEMDICKTGLMYIFYRRNIIHDIRSVFSISDQILEQELITS